MENTQIESVDDTHDERQQLADDIQRLKDVLQDEGDATQGTSGATILGDETEDEEDDDDDDDQDADSTLLSFEKSESGQLPMSTDACLALNRAYQEVIVEHLHQIQIGLENNRLKQQNLKHNMEEMGYRRQFDQDKLKHGRSILSFSIPYFKDPTTVAPANSMAHGPPANADVLLKKASNEVNHFTRPPKTWTRSECQNLASAVKKDTLQRQIRPLMNRKEIELEKLGNVKPNDAEEINENIEQLDKEIFRKRKIPTNQLLEDRNHLDEIDWMKISTVDFEGERSAMSCKLAWKNVLHPDINAEAWCPSEDESLLALVNKYDAKHWQNIAEDLNTGRTAFQCLQRYYNKLNPCLQTGKWIGEEDTILKEVVDRVKMGDYIPWNKVAETMEGRTPDQCKARWDTINIPNRKLGRWMLEEDVKLVTAVEMFGTSWDRVSENVPGRTKIQCRERYLNCLSEDLKFGNWTYEEDRTVWIMVNHYGAGSWAKVAEMLAGRTDAMVATRYKLLKRWQQAEKIMQNLPEPLHITADELIKNPSRIETKTCKVEKKKKQDKLYLEKALNILTAVKLDPKKAVVAKVIKDDNQKETEKLQASVHALHLLRENSSHSSSLSIEDIQLMQEDIANGLDIPRPQGNGRLTMSHIRKLEKRRQMHEAVQERIKKAMQQTGTVSSKTISDNLTKYFEEKMQEKELNVCQLKEYQMIMGKMKKSLVKEHAIPRKVKRLSKNKCEPRKGRPGKSDEMIELEEEIIQLLKGRRVTGKKVGRPRKYLVDNCLEYVMKHTGEEDEENRKKLTASISTLMLKAMSINIEDALINGYEMLQSERESDGDSLEQEEKNDSEVNSNGANESLTKGQNTGDDEKRMENAGSGESSVKDKLPVFSPTETDTDFQSLVKLCGVRPLPQIKHKVKAPHMVKTGTAANVYNIPPLPPNLSTVKTFEYLLLRRRSLVAGAGRLHKPGLLDKTREERAAAQHKAKDKCKKSQPKNNVIKFANVTEADMDSLREKLPNVSNEQWDLLRQTLRQNAAVQGNVIKITPQNIQVPRTNLPSASQNQSQPVSTTQPQPGSTNPGIQPQPGSTNQATHSEAGSSIQATQPGSTNQTIQPKPVTTVQAAQPQSGSTNQATEPQPGSSNLSSQPQPGSSNLSTQPQPGSSNLSSQPQPGSSNLSTQPQPGSSNLSSQPQPGSSNLSTQPQPGSSDLSSQPQPGSSNLSSQPQPGSSNLSTQPQPGSSDLSSQPQPGSSNLSSQPQPGSSNLSTPPQPGSSDLSSQPQPGSSNLSTEPQPGSSNLSSQPQPGSSNLSTQPQPGSSNLSTQPQPGSSNLSSQPQPGSSDLSSQPQPGSSNLSTQPQPGSSDLSSQPQPGSSDQNSTASKKAKLIKDRWEDIYNSHDYHMLRSRFMSLFLWPALLSTVPVDDIQAAQLKQQSNTSKKASEVVQQEVKRKRRKKNNTFKGKQQKSGSGRGRPKATPPEANSEEKTKVAKNTKPKQQPIKRRQPSRRACQAKVKGFGTEGASVQEETDDHEAGPSQPKKRRTAGANSAGSKGGRRKKQATPQKIQPVVDMQD